MKKQFKVILFSLITLIFLTMIGNFVVRSLDNNDEGKISLNKTASKQDDTYGRSVMLY